MTMVSNFSFSLAKFCLIICFLTKLLISGILFSTAVNAEVVAKPLVQGILLPISLNFCVWSVFLTKPLVSGILFL